MAHVSHKLSNAFEGALAGGGDPASSPLYVFGPFLRLIVVAGVAQVTFGASVWLVVFTVAMVSAMYRLVMRWVVDGSGGSGLSEEEFGSWAVKVNAGITFVEYTLTFLVSMAALVTFIADRYPALNDSLAGIPLRTLTAVAFSVVIGWLVNRGPKVAARAFGPATLGILLLLWAMILATIWKYGLRLPQINLQAFTPEYLEFTFGGYARILALMTGIEVFANLVAAYGGSVADRSRQAFGSLLIIMGTTCMTMLIVGPAILDIADPRHQEVSVFTQTMDALLPAPLPYIGTLLGVVVLASAAAASAQGLQNLALGLRYRQYIPAALGRRNRFDVADKPVWLEVAIVSVCFFLFGTHEETYLAIYAAGVFILLSMTGWAAAKRLIGRLRIQYSHGRISILLGTVLAAILTSIATVIIFLERFYEGAWTYFLLLPGLYIYFSFYRRKLGAPLALDDHLGRLIAGRYLLPYQREKRREDETRFDRILVSLDGSPFAESAVPLVEELARKCSAELTLVAVEPQRPVARVQRSEASSVERYLQDQAERLRQGGLQAEIQVRQGTVEAELDRAAHDTNSDLIVLCTRGRSGVERILVGSTAQRLITLTDIPVLLLRPTDDPRSRLSHAKKVLVALDGSHGAETVLRYARAVARYFGSEILLLSIPESETETQMLERYLGNVAEALREDGYRCDWQVTGSGPSRTIVEVAEEEGTDLILMATRGRRAHSEAPELGSVTEKVARATPVPLFVVPIRRPPERGD
jgi:nucleotide-binding universal stress UspA family protein